MPKLTPVAIDTNVVLNFAALHHVVIDCFETVKKRLQNVQIVILPTVILELTAIAGDDTDEASPLAQKSLASIIDPWKFMPVNCVPVGHGIVEQIGNRIRDKGLLPKEEVHDSFVIAARSLRSHSPHFQRRPYQRH
jgi:hypothetical protein